MTKAVTPTRFTIRTIMSDGLYGRIKRQYGPEACDIKHKQISQDLIIKIDMQCWVHAYNEVKVTLK